MTHTSTNRQPERPPQPTALRLFDLTILLILSPFLVVTIAVVGLSMFLRYGRPILFGSPRVGRGGAKITVWKFRTLDSVGIPLGPLPLWLRTNHLDELPQVWNIALGSMAWVGPRPLVASDHYALEDFAGRESVAPGITGPWQLTRSSKHDYSDMERLDAIVIDDLRLALRTSILARTLRRCALLAIGAEPNQIQPKGRWLEGEQD